VEIVIGAKQFPCQIYLNVVVSSCGLAWDYCKNRWINRCQEKTMIAN